MSRSTVLIWMIVLAAPAAWAQGSSSSKSQNVRSGKTVYDFSEVDILGKLKRPEGGSTLARNPTDFKRLLDLDESFIPNIVRAVDEF